MKSWRIEYIRAALKELEKLPNEVAKRVVRAIRGLSGNPRPHDSQKLVGEEGLYRIRVGVYRVVYEVREQEIVVLIIRIRHRKDTYR